MDLIQKREPAIDLMRFLGLSLIMIAHLGLHHESPFFQIRTFDVPLMVFVSGLAYSGKAVDEYVPFVWKRIKRLLIPLYLFLTSFFLAHYILSIPVETKKMLGSYLLLKVPSIGYVWIFRVFLIVTLLTPPLVVIERKLKGSIPVAMVFAASLVVQHYLVVFQDILDPKWHLSELVLYTVGYGAVFFLGLRMRKASFREGAFYTAVLAAAFIPYAFFVAAEKGSWLNMQAFKYPPDAYYLLWGALMSCIIWLTRKWWEPILTRTPLLFIGQNTIWIYLWHIAFCSFISLTDFRPSWLSYVLFFIVPPSVVLLQCMLVNRLEHRYPALRSILKYFKG